MAETRIKLSKFVTLITRVAGPNTPRITAAAALTLLRPAKGNAILMSQLRALRGEAVAKFTDDQVLAALADEVAKGTMILQDISQCDDSSNNRSRFFEQLPKLQALAQQLNVPEDFLVGLASYESGWFDDHNVKLNNLWGLTKAGGNNLSFATVDDGNAYFAKRIGPSIQGTQTIADFFAGLKKEGYNTVNPDYFSTDPKRGLLFNRISNIGKWKTKCGVS